MSDQRQSNANGRECGRGGERGGSWKKRQAGSMCVCLGKTTWGSVRFVFLTIYQHQAGFETPKPLNGCLTDGGFLAVRQGKKS